MCEVWLIQVGCSFYDDNVDLLCGYELLIQLVWCIVEGKLGVLNVGYMVFVVIELMFVVVVWF